MEDSTINIKPVSSENDGPHCVPTALLPLSDSHRGGRCPKPCFIGENTGTREV